MNGKRQQQLENINKCEPPKAQNRALFDPLELEERVFVLAQDGQGGLLKRVWIRVEVRCIGFSCDGGDDGCGELALQQSLPVEALEPLVLLDVVGATFETAIPLGQVRDQHFLYQRLGIAIKVTRKGHL